MDFCLQNLELEKDFLLRNLVLATVLELGTDFRLENLNRFPVRKLETSKRFSVARTDFCLGNLEIGQISV